LSPSSMQLQNPYPILLMLGPSLTRHRLPQSQYLSIIMPRGTNQSYFVCDFALIFCVATTGPLHDLYNGPHFNLVLPAWVHPPHLRTGDILSLI
jgi:hypothetical protein